MGLGMVATAGAGFLSLAAMTNIGYAHADDIGLVLGGSGTPIPGEEYVASAYLHYLADSGITSFYQGTPATLSDPLAPFGPGLPTPEGLYPLTGVHTLLLNYPSGSDGFPSESTSVGQGATILTNTIESYVKQPDPDTVTVFGYSQSSTISSVVMQQLTDDGISKDAVKFVLVGDPSAPDGGLLSRFDGFTDTAGMAHSLQLDLPSLGVSFDGATPASEYATSIYSIEYDGFTDFPKYPINFLADLNAFLGIETLHGTYLNGGNGIEGLGTGPSLGDINAATHLPVSGADLDTNYFMITSLGGTDAAAGTEITPPLVALLPAPLQALLGPDLTYLINLGYGDGSQGWADGPADVNTPFGLFPDVSLSDIFTNLATKTQDGITAFEAYLAAPPDVAPIVPDASGLDFSAFLTNLATDPTGTFTDLVNALTTASSAAYSALLPTTDIINALLTSMPAYDISLFTANIATGDFADAFGLPLAADTALFTLAGGFEVEVLQNAASEITAAFAGLFQ
jgi:hypothetical protein